MPTLAKCVLSQQLKHVPPLLQRSPLRETWLSAPSSQPTYPAIIYTHERTHRNTHTHTLCSVAEVAYLCSCQSAAFSSAGVPASLALLSPSPAWLSWSSPPSPSSCGSPSQLPEEEHTHTIRLQTSCRLFLTFSSVKAGEVRDQQILFRALFPSYSWTSGINNA